MAMPNTATHSTADLLSSRAYLKERESVLLYHGKAFDLAVYIIHYLPDTTTLSLLRTVTPDGLQVKASSNCWTEQILTSSDKWKKKWQF